MHQPSGQDGNHFPWSYSITLRFSELGVVMNTKCSEQEANTLWIHVEKWQNAMNMTTTIDRLESCKTRQYSSPRI
jgi:hypothetical protein